MMKKTANIIIVILFVFCVVLSSLSVDKVKAKKYDASYVLNYGDAKTRQFWNKIKIIKKVFGDKVDDVALAATILYGGTATSILQSEYDKNFDLNKFEDEVNSVNSAAISSSDTKYNKTEGRSDLLLAATIVMLDSSNFGTYSDENYEKALAGRNLVGNMFDDNYCKEDDEFKGSDENVVIERLNSIGGNLKSVGAKIFNATFCSAGALFDALATPFNFANYVLFEPADGDKNKDVGGFVTTTAQRYITMSNVCHDGYIGGTVYNVRKITNEKEKCQRKKKIAKEIIQLAQLYRKLFQEEKENICSTSSVDATAAANWRQCDSKWGKDKLGSSDQTICKSGCLATSMAYLISKSGTAISIKDFSPKTFVKNTSFSGANFKWDFTKAAPNFQLDKSNQSINKNNVVEKVKKELDTAKEVDGKKYQQFVVIQMTNHWVAVDHVENNTIYVLDPAADSGIGLVTLDQALNRGNQKRKLMTYNTLYALDVEYGKTGLSTETDNQCGGTLDQVKKLYAYLEGKSSNGCSSNQYKAERDQADADDVGVTTAYGLTSKFDAGLAKKVGYTSYLSDMQSGCVDKNYIEKMITKKVLSDYNAVKGYAKKYNVSLSENELQGFASLYHNSPNSARNAIRAINEKKWKINEYAYWNFFHSHGSSDTFQGTWKTNADDGLIRRRMVEYEVITKGNFNAKKTSKTYSQLHSIIHNQNSLNDYINKYWPSDKKTK